MTVNLEVIQIDSINGEINVNGTIVEKEVLVDLLDTTSTLLSTLIDIHLTSVLDDISTSETNIVKLDSFAAKLSQIANDVFPRSLTLIETLIAGMKSSWFSETPDIRFKTIHQLSTTLYNFAVLSVFSDDRVANAIIHKIDERKPTKVSISDIMNASFVHSVVIEKIIDMVVVLDSEIITSQDEILKGFLIAQKLSLLSIADHQVVLKNFIETHESH